MGSSRRLPAPRPRRGPCPRCAAHVRVSVATVLISSLSATLPGEEPERSLLLTVQLRNTSGSELHHVALRLPVPVTNDYQKIYNVYITPRPKGIIEAPDGGRLAFFDIERIEPEGVFFACMHIHCRMRSFEPHKKYLRQRLGRRQRDRCLGPSHRVEPDAEPVVRAATDLRREGDSDLNVVRRINRLLVAEFTYELDDRQTDAADTLAARSGSCSELARAFVALARHCGVPARFAAGSRLRADMDGYADGVHHRWVEVHLARYGWLPVDVSLNVLRGKTDSRFGSFPGGYLVLVRNAGLSGHFLFSGGLTLTSHANVLERRVRTFWFKGNGDRIREGVRMLASATDASPRSHDRLRKYVASQEPCRAVPFLSMLLYPPFPDDAQAQAVKALADAGVPSAVVPLVDLAQARPASASEAMVALQKLTGQRLGAPADWAAWLKADGLAFLRGKP